MKKERNKGERKRRKWREGGRAGEREEEPS